MRNNQYRWVFPEIVSIPGEFQSEIGGSPLVSQALFRRGITSLDQARGFLDPDFYRPASPRQLPGLEFASLRLIQAIDSFERILVWGDFDVDGQTSTALLVSGLKELGADVVHYIPNRSLESHGISSESLKQRIDQHSPAVLLTCDTGIDANPAVELASAHGIDTLITDHHQLPDAMPEAAAIINPNLLPVSHPLHHLPGVGVAYKLIEELFTHYGKDASPLLDLVALGIVADVANQIGDNRYLLQKGLPLLRGTRRPGLLALYKLAGINAHDINEETIGFVIGPRLNALGRLDDANTCVDFFTTKDPLLASTLAARLETLNLQRQELTERIFNEAQNMIQAYPELVDDYPILVLQGSADWHPGVIGIVASRLVERYGKPVIMLSRDGSIARGSARSVPGVPIASLLSQSSSLLISFGGHPMAAGLSLSLENIAPLRLELKTHFHTAVGPDPEPPPVIIDAELPFDAITTDLIEDMKRLSPFGAGNPQPLFATRGVHIADHSSIGRKRNHRKLIVEDSIGEKQQILWWNSADISLPDKPIDVVYSLDTSIYRDQPQIQATLVALRENLAAPIYLSSAPSRPELIDYRESPEPDALLDRLEIGENDLIWAEVDIPQEISSRPRLDLAPAETLVIWTAPPSQTALLDALAKTTPKRLVIFSHIPANHTISSFIPNLLGLIKNASSTQKPYHPDRFAQAAASTPSAVEAGLTWIHQHGDFDLSRFKESGLISSGGGVNLPGFSSADKYLKYLLKEIISYRTYFMSSRLDTIL